VGQPQGAGAGHINAAALRAFVSMYPGSKSELCREAEITPGHLWDLETFRNRGTSLALRVRVAGALGVPVEAITCRCGRPDGSCLSIGGGA
jgi:hypothetical protein